MGSNQAPKAFISHGSEDKERFVIQFATRLRKNGVDAWFDQWEISPGDSLVEKIFDEGMGKSDVVVIVITEFSINKPWVRQELNTAVVNRILEGIKIIPVVLDECKVPEALKSTAWIKIDDLNNYDRDFDRILASIFNQSVKPPIGQKPEYASKEYVQIPDLSMIDNLVFKEIYDYFVENNDYLVDSNKIFNENQNPSIPIDELDESINVLKEIGHIETIPSTKSCGIKSTVSGLHEYCKHYISDYESMIDNCGALLLNETGQATNLQIRDKLVIPIVIINNILKILEMNELVRLSQSLGERIHVTYVSPLLKRQMER